MFVKDKINIQAATRENLCGTGLSGVSQQLHCVTNPVIIYIISTTADTCHRPSLKNIL